MASTRQHWIIACVIAVLFLLMFNVCLHTVINTLYDSKIVCAQSPVVQENLAQDLEIFRDSKLYVYKNNTDIADNSLVHRSQCRTYQSHSAIMQKFLRLVKVYLLTPNVNKQFRKKVNEFSGIFRRGREFDDVDCSKIIEKDSNETIRAKQIMESKSKQEISTKQYIEMTINCSSFIFHRNYIISELTDVEKTFSIAYSIVMYKNVEQGERLLRAIYRPQNYYCIHVDNKSNTDIFQAMSAIAGCFSNVFVTNQRVDVQWGTMSVLEAELVCMEELWNRSATWKYFINLTGQEFPLRTNYELVQILRAYNGANDVNGTREWANKDRWVNAGQPPHGIVPTKGSVHVVVSRGFVDYVLHDRRAQDILNWTAGTIIPDETFFSSLNHNPILGVPGSYTGTPEGTRTYRKPFLARFKNWEPPQGDYLCQGKYVRDICIFGIGDLPTLSNTIHLFANKFHIDYQPFALDCMEELHYNRTRDEYLGKLLFKPDLYSKLGFVRDKIVGKVIESQNTDLT